MDESLGFEYFYSPEEMLFTICFPNEKYMNISESDKTTPEKIIEFYEGTKKKECQLKIKLTIGHDDYQRYKSYIENRQCKLPITWSVDNNEYNTDGSSYIKCSKTYYGPLETKEIVIASIRDYYSSFDYELN